MPFVAFAASFFFYGKPYWPSITLFNYLSLMSARLPNGNYGFTAKNEAPITAAAAMEENSFINLT